MDRERLGRVLGRGARLAARTALEAADAATSPAPDAIRSHPVPPRASTARQARSAAEMGSALRNLPSAAAASRASVLAPLGRASRALWHELTGSFFALFALSFGTGAWRTSRSALPADRHRFYAFCALALLFACFSISSFVRARRRD